jgi:hypothetical protein
VAELPDGRAAGTVRWAASSFRRPEVPVNSRSWWAAGAPHGGAAPPPGNQDRGRRIIVEENDAGTRGGAVASPQHCFDDRVKHWTCGTQEWVQAWFRRRIQRAFSMLRIRRIRSRPPKDHAMRFSRALATLVLTSGFLLAVPGVSVAHPTIAGQVGPVVPSPPMEEVIAPPTDAPGPPTRPPGPPPRPAPASPPVEPSGAPPSTPPSAIPSGPAADTPDPTASPGVVPELAPAPSVPSSTAPTVSTSPSPSMSPSASVAAPPDAPASASAAPALPRPANNAVGVGGVEAPAPAVPSSNPSGSVRTAPAEDSTTAQPPADEAFAAPAAQVETGPPLRYVAAGILSIVAVALALGVAVVSQPRRTRRTH